MPELDAVLLDLDETLLDDETSMRAALREVCAWLQGEHGLPAERLFRAYLDVASRAWPRLGSVPTEGRPGLGDGWAIRVWMWREALGAVGAGPDIAEQAAGRYRSARRLGYALFDDVLPALERLAGGYRLGLVTNGPGDTQREKVEALGIGRYLETVAISGEIGSGKPDPEIFRVALAALGVRPHRAAHVGDSLESDVRGALRAEVRAVWLNRRGATRPPGAAEPDATIRTLAELPGLLGRAAGGAPPSP